MPYNVTSLVNNIVLPATEPSDIIGIDRLKDVVNWILIPNADPMNLAVAYSTGGVASLILVEDVIFVGTVQAQRDDIDVRTIAKRIEAHRGFENSPR